MPKPFQFNDPRPQRASNVLVIAWSIFAALIAGIIWAPFDSTYDRVLGCVPRSVDAVAFENDVTGFTKFLLAPGNQDIDQCRLVAELKKRPALYEVLRELMLDGFQYSAVTDTLGRSFTLTGIRNWPAASSAHKAEGGSSVSADQTKELLIRFRQSSDYRHLFKVTQHIAEACHDSEIDRQLSELWQSDTLWLEQHLPYAIAFVGPIDVRVHTSTQATPKETTYRQQIAITLRRVCRASQP